LGRHAPRPWQFPPPLTTGQSGVVGSSPTATNSRTALLLNRRNTHCNTTFPASQWQAPKGVAVFTSGSKSKNNLAPSALQKGQLSVFLHTKMLLTYLCFYQFLLTPLHHIRILYLYIRYRCSQSVSDTTLFSAVSMFPLKCFLSHICLFTHAV